MLTEFGAGISSIEGRAAQTTNIVLGGDTSLQTWRELDEKVKLCRATMQSLRIHRTEMSHVKSSSSPVMSHASEALTSFNRSSMSTQQNGHSKPSDLAARTLCPA